MFKKWRLVLALMSHLGTLSHLLDVFPSAPLSETALPQRIPAACRTCKSCRLFQNHWPKRFIDFCRGQACQQAHISRVIFPNRSFITKIVVDVLSYKSKESSIAENIYRRHWIHWGFWNVTCGDRPVGKKHVSLQISQPHADSWWEGWDPPNSLNSSNSSNSRE